MPTYTAIAMDRLIESGGSKSMTTSKIEASFDRSKNGSSSKLERKIIQTNVKMDDSNGKPSIIGDRKDHWTQISPALYTIPKPTPLPDSPSSFPPSPYIINHKRRGPRLSQSFTEDDFGTQQEALDGEKMDEKLRETKKDLSSKSLDDPSISRRQLIVWKRIICYSLLITLLRMVK